MRNSLTPILFSLGVALAGCASTSPVSTAPESTLEPTQAQATPNATESEQTALDSTVVAAKSTDSAPETDQSAAIQPEPKEVSSLADPFTLLEDTDARGPRDLVIVAVGDVSQPGKQWVEDTQRLKATVFDPTRHLLTGDLNFMNLENPVTSVSPNAKKTYAFTSPPERLDWYMGAGFNMFSLANNHIADADQFGIDDTVRNLDLHAKKNGKTVYHAGAGTTPAEGLSPKYFKPEGKDLTIAFFSLGFSRSPNVGKFYDDKLIDEIKEANQKADIVFVSVHAGKEYKHIPEANLQTRYRSWVDAGADLVVGHHTHCIQPVEQYKDGLIMYSLGNYVFSSRTVRHRKMGAKLYGMMSRIVISDGKVYGAQIVPLWVNNSDTWKLETGEVLANANFVPKVLTGPFADAWFEDFDNWTQKTGATPLDRVGDIAFIRMKPYTRDIAFRW